MNLTEPMCIIGASMGGTVVCMFAVKYPQYVGMICLLAPMGKIEEALRKHRSITYLCDRIGNKESETDLIRQLRSGDSTALLPETPEQLRHMINTLAVKRVDMPNFFVNGFLDLRLRLLAEHKKGNQSHSLLASESYLHIRTNSTVIPQWTRTSTDGEIMWRSETTSMSDFNSLGRSR